MEKDKNSLGLDSTWSEQGVPQKIINREGEIQTETRIFLVLNIYFHTFRGDLEQTLSKFGSCQNPQDHAKDIFSASFEQLVDSTADTFFEGLGKYLRGP